MVIKGKTRAMTRNDIKNGIFVYAYFSYFKNTTIGFFNGNYTYSINQFGQIVEINNDTDPFPDRSIENLCVLDKADGMRLLRNAHSKFAEKYKSQPDFEQAIFERYKFDFDRSITVVEEIDTNQDCREVLSKLYQDFKNFPKSRYAVTNEMLNWEKKTVDGTRRRIGLIFNEPKTESNMKMFIKNLTNLENLIFTPIAIPENDITKTIIERNNHYIFGGTSLDYVAKK